MNNLTDLIISKLEEKGNKTKIRNGEIWTNCIYHEENTPSLSINIEKGVYHCFGCGAKGTIQSLAKDLGIPIKSHKHKEISSSFPPQAKNYLRERLLLSNEDIEYYARALGVKGVFHKYKYPAIDFYAYKDPWKYLRRIISPKEEEPKYSISHRKKKKIKKEIGYLEFVRGWVHKQRETNKDVNKHYIPSIVITEGPFDALTWWTFGIPAVFTQGAISKEQKEELFNTLHEFFKEIGSAYIYFSFDNDKRGKDYTTELNRYILNKTYLIPYIIDIPKEINGQNVKDINEALQVLGREAFEEQYARAVKSLNEAPIKIGGLRYKIQQEAEQLILSGNEMERQAGLMIVVASIKEIKGTGEKISILKKDLVGWLSEITLLNKDEIFDLIEKEFFSLEDFYKKERLKEVLEEIKEKAERTLEPFETLSSNLINSLIRISEEEERDIPGTLEEARKMMKEELSITLNGIQTPILKALDTYANPQDLILITGETGGGKTTLALNLAKEFLETGKSVAYFTYEIGPWTLALTLTGIFLDKGLLYYAREKSLIKGIEDINLRETLSREERIKEVMEKIEETVIPYMLNKKLFIFRGKTIEKVVEILNKYRPNVFIIDYDNKVPINKMYQYEEQKLSYISNTLLGLTKQLNSVGILLSQVNSNKEARGSMAKVHDASLVLYVCKDCDTTLDEEDRDPNQIFIEVKKNRWGKLSKEKIPLKIDWRTRRIYPFQEDINPLMEE